MGNPIRVSAEHREGILTIADAMLSDGRILDQSVRRKISRAAEGLRDGYDIYALELARTIYRIGDDQQRQFARIVGESVEGKEFGLSRFARHNIASRELNSNAIPLDELPLPNFLAAGMAFRRVDEVADPLNYDPVEAITYIFESFGSERRARETTFGEYSYSAYDTVRQKIRARLTNQILSCFRTVGSELIIPRPRAFRALLMERFDIDEEVMGAWERTAYWKPAVAAFFAEILANGTFIENIDYNEVESPASDAANWKEAHARRESWFEYLMGEGYSSRYLEMSIGIEFSEGSKERTLALAELSRFVNAMTEQPWNDELAPEIFFRSLTLLHTADPFMDLEDFTGLLVPLARPMDMGSIDRLMSKHADDPIAFKRRKAVDIFAWHVEGPAAIAQRICKLIMGNRAYDTLDQFLDVRFSVKLDQFQRKLEMLGESGVSIDPILQAVRLKFGAYGKQINMFGFEDSRYDGPDDDELPQSKKDDVAPGQLSFKDIEGMRPETGMPMDWSDNSGSLSERFEEAVRIKSKSASYDVSSAAAINADADTAALTSNACDLGTQTVLPFAGMLSPLLK